MILIIKQSTIPDDHFHNQTKKIAIHLAQLCNTTENYIALCSKSVDMIRHSYAEKVLVRNMNGLQSKVMAFWEIADSEMWVNKYDYMVKLRMSKIERALRKGFVGMRDAVKTLIDLVNGEGIDEGVSSEDESVDDVEIFADLLKDGSKSCMSAMDDYTMAVAKDRNVYYEVERYGLVFC